MAVLQGEQGSVQFSNASGTALAAIVGTRSWTLNVTKETIDTTSQQVSGATGEGFRTFVGSFVSGSGTVEIVYDNAQSTQDPIIQDILTAKDPADATFELFTTGTTADANSVTFAGIITSFDISSTAGDLVVATCNFITSGGITLNL